MKLLDMLCRATQDRWVMVESSDKCGPLEKGMANHLTILALRTPREFDNEDQRDLVTELTQDWENRMLEGTTKSCATMTQEKEQ